MAEILTPTAEVRLADSKAETEKKNYKKWLKLYAKGHVYDRLGALLRCAMIHNIHEAGSYYNEASSWMEYCAKINLNKRTSERYIQVARGLLKKCGSIVQVIDGKFLFDETKVEAEFKDLLKRDGEITLETLRAMGAESNELRNYFYDEHAGADIKTEDAITMLIGETPVTEGTPATGGPLTLPKQGGLFDLTERLQKAGYIYDANLNKWARPDGTEITHEELGEFISPADAAEIFGDLKKCVTPAREHFVERADELKQYLIAFKKAHRTPMSEDFIKEKFGDLMAEMRLLLHEASTLLKEEEA